MIYTVSLKKEKKNIPNQTWYDGFSSVGINWEMFNVWQIIINKYIGNFKVSCNQSQVKYTEFNINILSKWNDFSITSNALSPTFTECSHIYV